MSRALPTLTTTGDPAHTGLETNIRRMADQMHSQLNAMDGGDVSYHPSSVTDWSGNPPRTIAQALDRIAAALGPIT